MLELLLIPFGQGRYLISRDRHRDERGGELVDTLKLICGFIGLIGLAATSICLILEGEDTWGLLILIFTWLVVTGFSGGGRR